MQFSAGNSILWNSFNSTPQIYHRCVKGEESFGTIIDQNFSLGNCMAEQQQNAYYENSKCSEYWGLKGRKSLILEDK